MGARLIDRAERLSAIERMLFRNSSGLRAVEIAAACGVDRRTIYRDLDALDKLGIPISQQDGRFFQGFEAQFLGVRESHAAPRWLSTPHYRGFLGTSF